MKFIKLGLLTKILVASLVPSIIVGLGLSWYYSNNHYQTLKMQLVQKGEVLVKQLGPTSEYAVFIKSPALLEELVSPLLNDPDIAKVEIFDNAESLLLSKKNLDLIANHPNSLIEFNHVIELQDIPASGNSSFELGLDLVDADEASKSIGYIVLALSSYDIEQKIIAGIFASAPILILSLLLSALLSIYVTTTIRNPIAAVRNALKLIQKPLQFNQFEQTIDGEIGLLQSQFKQSYYALEQQRNNYEAEILALQSTSSAQEIEIKSQYLLMLAEAQVLKESLNNIISSFNVMHKKEAFDHDKFKTILIALRDHSNQIENFNCYFEFKNNSWKIQSRYVNIKHSLARILSPVISKVYKNNIRVNSQIDHNLEKYLVFTDERLLNLLLRNVIEHSIAFTQNGYIDINIKHHITNTNQFYFSLMIEDSSSGISLNDLKSVSKPFLITDNISAENFRSGFHLALAYELVKLLNGHLQVETNQNIGAKYTLELTLPFKKAQKEVTKGLDSDNEVIRGKALLVDSSIVSQSITKELLSLVGLNVETAVSATIALEKIRYHDYTHVLIDEHLKDATASELISRLTALSKAKKSELRLLLITPDRNALSQSHFSSLTEENIVLKPIELWDLKRKLLPILES